jgi:hypothetical protein
MTVKWALIPLNVSYASQNLLNIAPKRPNWDLKRDLDRLNQKLRPQTDDAIRSIIRAFDEGPDPLSSARLPLRAIGAAVSSFPHWRRH